LLQKAVLYVHITERGNFFYVLGLEPVNILYGYISAFIFIFKNTFTFFTSVFPVGKKQREHKAANKCRLYKLNFPKLVDFFGSFPKLGKILTTETLTVLSKKRWLIQTLKKSDLVYIFDIKQADQTTLQISKRNGMAAKALISETAAAI
jgi:hypothetical protein